MITIDPVYLLVAIAIDLGLLVLFLVLRSKKKVEQSGSMNETGWKYRRKNIIN